MSDSAIQPFADPNVEVFAYEIKEVSVAGMTAILVHNDEVTPYDYVIHILVDLFMLSEELADHIAWTAHTKGTATVVMRPRAEAEKLVKVAHGRARQIRYPLTFSLEQG